MNMAVKPASLYGLRSKLGRKAAVMIVDDSLTVRTVLSRTIEKEPDLHVVATANTAEQALAKLDEASVDIILLDLEMPGMGGIAALPTLLEKSGGAKIMVVSALTEVGAKHTLSALSMGAVDTLLKPSSGTFDDTYRAVLVEKIRGLCDGLSQIRETGQSIAVPPPQLRKPSRKLARVVAIGGSTGGIHALCQFLRNLPERVGVPILVTQHLPSSFVSVLARQIELASGRTARVAKENIQLEPDKILIAPGDSHMVITKAGEKYVASTSREIASSGCMPSADPMFRSVGDVFGDRGLGIVLSGMGRDGIEGAARIVEQGGTMIAQNEESSAVWGMPRAVVEAGFASAILTPEEIAREVSAKTDLAAWN